MSGRDQDLRVLEGRYAIEQLADADAAPPAGWLALVRAPDGLTVLREDADGDWVALWSGDEPHDPEATGMLRALVAPLADAGLPVIVASSYSADLVLVPAARLDQAVAALRAAGHRVTG